MKLFPKGIFYEGTEGMTPDPGERRRSDRLWVTFPLRVGGLDSHGQTVEYPGRAVNLNRHGGRIQIAQEIDPGQSIRVRSPIGRFEAEFRVVDTIASHRGQGCECGVERLNDEEDFWGIEFPSRGDEALDAKVLLECDTCHRISLVPLAFMEIETLRMIGMVGLDCPKCSEVTFWRYAEIRVPSNRESGHGQSLIEGQANWIKAISSSVDRGHPRVYMQMPLAIRDYKGISDMVRTENISECGLYFSTEKTYSRGEIVTAAFPLASITQLSHLPARIVREWVMEGSPSRFYGATFEAGGGGCHGT
ncbi:MAG TPA: PilZ domain-containing protein [Terriglobia bacterium]|nr:PilZ domain-containing protein [Terriglobia bacterium]